MKRMLNYFFPRKNRPRGVPTHLIAPYDITKATREQKLAMMTGRVRSPDTFDRLAEKHGVTKLRELLPFLPAPRRTLFSEKLLALLWRWNGHYRGKPYKFEGDNRLGANYRFKS
jgi:hypothetical protein